MFGIKKSEGYYWVETSKTSKVGHKSFIEAMLHVITGIV